MSIKISKKILGKAIEEFGEEKLHTLLSEECLELSHAIHKLKFRDRGKEKNKIKAVLGEIADVKIFLDSVILLYPEEDLQKVIDQKLKRLKKRTKIGVM